MKTKLQLPHSWGSPSLTKQNLYHANFGYGFNRSRPIKYSNISINNMYFWLLSAFSTQQIFIISVHKFIMIRNVADVKGVYMSQLEIILDACQRWINK